MGRRVLIFTIITFLMVGNVLALEKLTGYVNDEAGVISPEYENLMTAELMRLKANTSVEMAVATVKTTGGVPIEEYSLNLAHKTLGVKGKDNGLLILLAVDDHRYRIEVGYGLEGTINAAKAGRIGRTYMEPFFKKADYQQGLIQGVLELSAAIQNTSSYETTPGAIEMPNTETLILISTVLLLILTIGIISAVSYAKRKGMKNDDLIAAIIASQMFGRRGGGSGGFGGGGFGGFGGGGFGGGGFSGKF